MTPALCGMAGSVAARGARDAATSNEETGLRSYALMRLEDAALPASARGPGGWQRDVRAALEHCSRQGYR